MSVHADTMSGLFAFWLNSFRRHTGSRIIVADTMSACVFFYLYQLAESPRPNHHGLAVSASIVELLQAVMALPQKIRAALKTCTRHP